MAPSCPPRRASGRRSPHVSPSAARSARATAAWPATCSPTWREHPPPSDCAPRSPTERPPRRSPDPPFPPRPRWTVQQYGSRPASPAPAAPIPSRPPAGTPADLSRENDLMPALITPELVVLDADLGADKDAVVRRLAGLVAGAGRATSAEALHADAMAREAQAPTGLPGGIAIPHCRSAAVTE